MKRDKSHTPARPPFLVAAAATLAVAAVLVGTRHGDDPAADAVAPPHLGAALLALAAPAQPAAAAAPLVLQQLATGVDDRRVAHFQALVAGGHIPRYRWDFGDGSTPPAWSVLSSAQHAYRRPGRYTVTLRVAAARGEIIVHRQEVAVP